MILTTRVKSDGGQTSQPKTRTRITKSIAAATKRDAARPSPSTNVSSPVRAKGKKKKDKAVVTHDGSRVTRWTDTLDKMYLISDIDRERVARYGAKFLPLFGEFRQQHCDMMGIPDPRTSPDASGSHDVIDLISSDIDEMTYANDAADEEADGEVSPYFEGSMLPA